MRRRELIAGAGITLAATTAGCTSVLNDEPVAFEAALAQVPEEVAREAGYELDEFDEQVIERTFEAAGQSQTVQVTNRTAEYEKAIDLGPLGELRAAIFTALSTPKVEVLGRTFNPVDDLSNAELAEMIQDQYADIGDLEVEHESPVTILGTDTTQTKFAGEIRMEGGEEIDIYLHVSSPVESGDDLVIGVGAYPQRLPGEEEHVLTMMEAIEHDA